MPIHIGYVLCIMNRFLNVVNFLISCFNFPFIMQIKLANVSLYKGDRGSQCLKQLFKKRSSNEFRSTHH